MPITIEEAVTKLEASGLKVVRASGWTDHCALLMQTDEYVDADGDHCLQLACRVDHGGTYLEIAAPRAYNSHATEHRAALFEALLGICYHVKHARAEHDARDGEIRLAMDLPVLDATVTPHQLWAMVHGLVKVIDEFHMVVVHAMESGEVDMRWRRSCRLAEDDDGPGTGDDDGASGPRD